MLDHGQALGSVVAILRKEIMRVLLPKIQLHITSFYPKDWQKKGTNSKGFFLARAPNVPGPYSPVSGDWNVTTITWEQDVACIDPFI
jgi:hypothetical protein